MPTRRSGIYVITHTTTGRRYVGQSINLDQRRRDHASGKTGTGKLTHAIAKHGWNSFEFEVLEFCTQDDLNEAEVRWIAALNCLHPHGFNLTTGGQKFRFTDEVRKLISERTKVFMTPEWCERRAQKVRGVPKSAEHRAAIGAAQRNPDNIARIIAMARNQSAETREKIAATHRGKKVSDETRAKISAAKTGKKLPPQTAEDRAKKSVALKAAWARKRELGALA